MADSLIENLDLRNLENLDDEKILQIWTNLNIELEGYKTTGEFGNLQDELNKENISSLIKLWSEVKFRDLEGVDENAEFMAAIIFSQASQTTTMKRGNDDLAESGPQAKKFQFFVGAKSMECEFCHQIFSNKASRDRHIDIQHNGVRYKCFACWKLFTSKNIALVHYEKFHDASSSLPDEEKIVEIRIKIKKCDLDKQRRKVPGKSRDGYNYICEICDLGFKAQILLEQHRNSAHFRAEYECSACNVIATSESEIYDHIKIAHKNARSAKIIIHRVSMDLNQSLKRDLLIQCKMCETRFESMEDKKKHILTVHGMPFGCSECEKEFPSRNSANNHIGKAHRSRQDFMNSLHGGVSRIHVVELTPKEPEIPVMIEEDGPIIKVEILDESDSENGNEMQMPVNLSPYLGVNVYKCDFAKCGEVFSHKFNLTEHKLTHRDDGRTAKCPFCTAVYKTDQGLKNHINVHYTRFDCLKCGALFINKIAAELHMKNEHSDGITDCEVGKIRLESLVGLSRCDKCGGEFRSCAELTQHKETQHTKMAKNIGGVKYQCSKCLTLFATRAGCIQHKHCDHPGEEVTVDKISAQIEMGDVIIPKCLQTNKTAKYKSYEVFQCELCDDRFLSKAARDAHLDDGHIEGKYIFVCQACNNGFETLKGANQHASRLHKGELAIIKKVKGSLSTESIKIKNLHASEKKKAVNKANYQKRKMRDLVFKSVQNRVQGGHPMVKVKIETLEDDGLEIIDI